MEKLPCEMSKKILSPASTLMRAIEVEIFGKRTTAIPLFGTFVARTIGKVEPPSVESRMLTLAALIGGLLVPATSQVTQRYPAQEAAAAGAVMRKGPAAPMTVTCIVALATPPPPV